MPVSDPIEFARTLRDDGELTDAMAVAKFVRAEQGGEIPEKRPPLDEDMFVFGGALGRPKGVGTPSQEDLISHAPHKPGEVMPVGQRAKHYAGAIAGIPLDLVATAEKSKAVALWSFVHGLNVMSVLASRLDPLHLVMEKPEWVDAPLEDFAAYKKGQAIQGLSNDLMDPALANNFSTQLIKGAGSFLLPFGIGALGEAAGLGKAGLMAITGLSGGAQEGIAGYDRAKAAGANETKAVASGLLNFGAGLSEMVPVVHMLGRYKKVLGAAASKRLMAVIAESAVEGGIDEGLQEFFQTGFGEAVAKKILKYEDDTGWTDILKQAAVGGLAGGIVGSVVSAATSTTGYAQRRSLVKKIQERARYRGIAKTLLANDEAKARSIASKKVPSRSDVRDVEPDLKRSEDRAKFRQELGQVIAEQDYANRYAKEHEQELNDAQEVARPTGEGGQGQGVEGGREGPVRLRDNGEDRAPQAQEARKARAEVETQRESATQIADRSISGDPVRAIVAASELVSRADGERKSIAAMVTSMKGRALDELAKQYGLKGFGGIRIEAKRRRMEAELLRRTIGSTIGAVTDAWLGRENRARGEARAQELRNQKAISAMVGDLNPLTGKLRYGKKSFEQSQAMYAEIQKRHAPDAFEENLAAMRENADPKDLEAITKPMTDSPEAQKIVSQIVSQMDRLGAFLESEGMVKEFLENYMPIMYEAPEGGWSPDAIAKFSLQTGRTKKRTLPSVFDGLAMGLKLKVNDALTAQKVAFNQVMRTVENRIMVEAAISHDQMTTNRYKKTPEGKRYKEITHPGFYKWDPVLLTEADRSGLDITEETGRDAARGDLIRAPDRENYGNVKDVSSDTRTALVEFTNPDTGAKKSKTFSLDELRGRIIRLRGDSHYFSPDGRLFIKKRLYAVPQLADNLNRILSSTDAFKRTARMNSALKHTILTMSFFHHIALIRSYMAGRGLNPVEALRAGKAAMEGFGPDVQDLLLGGFTFGEELRQHYKDVNDEHKMIVEKILDNTAVTKGTKDAFLRVRDWWTNELFGKFAPYLKLHAALLEYKHTLAKFDKQIREGATDSKGNLITRESVARDVAKLMNRDFGGLMRGMMGHGDVRGRSASLQRGMDLMLLAADWTESNIRSMIAALPYVPGGDVEKFIHRQFWYRIFRRYTAATVLSNMMMSAFDDRDFWERMKDSWSDPKYNVHWYDLRWTAVDMTPAYQAITGDLNARFYFSLLGHLGDPLKFLVHFTKSAKNKSSPLLGPIIDLFTGTDYKGWRFSTLAELLGLSAKRSDRKYKGKLVIGKYTGRSGPIDFSETPSFSAYEISQKQPIPFQNLTGWLVGQQAGLKAALGSFGIQTSVAYRRKRRR